MNVTSENGTTPAYEYSIVIGTNPRLPCAIVVSCTAIIQITGLRISEPHYLCQPKPPSAFMSSLGATQGKPEVARRTLSREPLTR
jgi:hypothetical protein